MKYLILVLFVFTAAHPLYAASGPYQIEGQNIADTANVSASATMSVVVFLSAKCPCSHSHLSEIAELSKSYPTYKFIGVHSNMDESEEVTKSYFVNAKLPFPVVQDQGTKIADHFKAIKTPHAYILGANGDILYQGGVSDSKDCSKAGRKLLREALEDLKNNRPVKTPFARALGCSISRRKS